MGNKAFTELHQPEEYYCADGKVYWLVRAVMKSDLMLHNDGHIYIGVERFLSSVSYPVSIAMFDNAQEAFDAACWYYNSYGLVYPYLMPEEGIFTVLGNALAGTIESEVMEF